MTYTDISVAGNMQYVQTCVQQLLQASGYSIQWKDQYSGTASRGSKGMQVAFGAVAEYSEVDFQIFAGPDQSTVVRLFLASSGWWGGLMGAMRAKDNYLAIANYICTHFGYYGILRGRVDG